MCVCALYLYLFIYLCTCLHIDQINTQNLKLIFTWGKAIHHNTWPNKVQICADTVHNSTGIGDV